MTSQPNVAIQMKAFEECIPLVILVCSFGREPKCGLFIVVSVCNPMHLNDNQGVIVELQVVDKYILIVLLVSNSE